METIDLLAANTSNISAYRKFGIDDSESKHYICLACNRSVSISDSYSSTGSNLMCTSCVNKLFKPSSNYFKWANTYTLNDCKDVIGSIISGGYNK